jgi:hypothetical protein
MRRPAVAAVLAALTLFVSAPAYGFAHDRVANPYLHAVLDVLTLAVVTAPLWTLYVWGRRPGLALVGLVALVQLPVGVIGFVPILDPRAHAVALIAALAVTGAALWLVRQPAAGQSAVGQSGAR